MPLICNPAITLPENIISLDDTLTIYQDIYGDHPQLDTALDIARNTSVKKRHLIQPKEVSFQNPGVEERHKLYEENAKRLVPICVQESLDHANLLPQDIHQIIAVSCTGFLFPSITAWLIDKMGFSPYTKQLPIAQLGCAGGASAINRAQEYCTAFPEHNVLIVCVEFSSMLYQPTDEAIGSLLSYSLFGDAVSSCVVKGKKNVTQEDVGVFITKNMSYVIPNTERYIAYDIKETGFHFVLDRNVKNTMAAVAPAIQKFLSDQKLAIADMSYFIFHTGGPQIMSELIKHLSVPESMIQNSRRCLEECGNVASVVVFDVIRRLLGNKDDFPANGALGLMAGFGPGVTAEVNLSYFVG